MAEIARTRPLAAPVRRLGMPTEPIRGTSASPTRMQRRRNASHALRALRTTSFRQSAVRRGTFWIERAVWSTRMCARTV